MIETDIRELNERIKNESHFIDLITINLKKYKLRLEKNNTLQQARTM